MNDFSRDYDREQPERLQTELVLGSPIEDIEIIDTPYGACPDCRGALECHEGECYCPDCVYFSMGGGR